MEVKPILLDEVIVSNAEAVIKKVYNNLAKNYMLAPYTENFFLRCLMKKNNELARLQDVFGKVNRNTMFKTPEIKENKYQVEILNMRKIDLKEKQDISYFALPPFHDLFQTMSYILLDDEGSMNFTEVKTEEDGYRKINFISKTKRSDGQLTIGFFIVKKEDYALTHFSFNCYDDVDAIAYQQNKNGHKFRTTKLNVSASYNKNNVVGKYFLSNANFDFKVEILADKEIEKNNYYDTSINYFITKNFTNEKVNSNFQVNKDIFKAKFPYSEDFWKNQNQLPLTSELNVFIAKVNKDKENKKEFEVI